MRARSYTHIPVTKRSEKESQKKNDKADLEREGKDKRKLEREIQDKTNLERKRKNETKRERERIKQIYNERERNFQGVVFRRVAKGPSLSVVFGFYG